MSIVNIEFPGNLAQVDTAPELRRVPVGVLNSSVLALVVALEGMFKYDSGSFAADDGTTVLKPDGVTTLQAGRWVKSASAFGRGPQGLPGEGIGTTIQTNVPGGNGGQGFSSRLMVFEDNRDATAGGAGKSDALQIVHSFGGSLTKGGRHAIETFCVQIAPTPLSNPDQNYVGGAFTGFAQSHDNGTAEASRGGMFGINGVGRLGANATFYHNVTGAEFNTEVVEGASVHYKSLIQLTGFATDTVRGTDYDAMISLSRQAGGVSFKDGILFSEANGQSPMGADSSLMRTQGVAQCLNGIDLSSYIFTGYGLRIGNAPEGQRAGVGIRQFANGTVGLHFQRFTDTAPTGNILQLVNSTNTAVITQLTATGVFTTENVISGAMTANTLTVGVGGLDTPIARVGSGGVVTPTVDNGLNGVLAIGGVGGAAEIQIRKPLVTSGTTTPVTLASTGGAGPTTAAQNSWVRFLDSTGVPFWVPAWK